MPRAFFAILGLYITIVVILVLRIMGPIIDSLDQQMNGHAAQIRVPSMVPMAQEIDSTISAHSTLFVHMAAIILAMIISYVVVLFTTHMVKQIALSIRRRLTHGRQMTAYNMLIERATRR